MPLATDLICMDRSMVVLPDMIQMHSTVMLQLRSYALVSFTCSLRAMQIRDLPPSAQYGLRVAQAVPPLSLSPVSCFLRTSTVEDPLRAQLSHSTAPVAPLGAASCTSASNSTSS